MTDVARAWKADVACVAGLALAVAGFFPHVVIDWGVFFVQDMMVQNVPFRHFLHEALAAGRLPLWEPRINAGFPLFAEGQVGALYPPNWIGAALLSPAQAVTWSVLVHLWAAAAGTFLYLRRGLGAGRAAALTSGLCFGLSGYLVVRAMSPNFVAAAAGVPFLFLLIESGIRGMRPVRIGAAGAVAALQLLAGHPQAAAYSALAATVYGAVRAGQLGRWHTAVIGLAIAVPGVAIAAVQVLPTMELASLSPRAGGIDYEQFVSMSLPPERLLTLLLPDLFGNSAHGSYWGGAGGDGFFIQLCPYVGVLTLLLALVGAREGGSSARGFFALLAVMGLALSLGKYTGLFDLLHQVPLLRQFRIPTRFLLWWAFAAAVLCGLGVDRLTSDRRPLLTSWRFLWVTLVLLVIAATASVGADAARSLADLPAGPRQMLLRLRPDLIADLWRALAVLGVAAVLFSDRFRRHRTAPTLSAIAVVVVTWADLRSFGADFNGTLPESVYTTCPVSAAAIHADDANDGTAALPGDVTPGVPPWGRFRVAGLISERNAPYDWHSGWAVDDSSYRQYPATLRMYSAGLYGLANTMPGWSPLHLSAHWEFSRGYPAWLGMANARYLVTHRPLSKGLAEPVHAGKVTVSRLRQALPRAWVAPGAVILADGEARLRHMRSSTFDPRRQVVIDRVPKAPSPTGTGFAPARIVQYETERVVVDLPGRDGYLVLADTQAPGWQARVDGVAREILLANHVFRAVAVTAGETSVEFDYRPRTVVVGAWVSGVAVLLWLGLCLMSPRAASEGAGSKVREAGFLVPLALQLSLVVVLYGIASETALWRAVDDRLRPGQVLRGAVR